MEFTEGVDDRLGFIQSQTDVKIISLLKTTTSEIGIHQSETFEDSDNVILENQKIVRDMKLNLKILRDRKLNGQENAEICFYGFFCSDCDFKSTSEILLRAHLKLLHRQISAESDLPIEPEVEIKPTGNENSPIDETDDPSDIDETDDPSYIDKSESHQCRQCRQYFASKGKLQRHRISVHKDSKITILCEFCPETFTNDGNLQKHKQEFHLNSSVCHMCKLTFKTAKGQRVHMRKYHDMSNTFECERCHYRFADDAGLCRHVETIHENIFKCSICLAVFDNSNSLFDHARALHGLKSTILCDQCPKVFRHQTSLYRHRQLVHFNRKYLVCDICTKGFGQASTYRHHMRTVHNQMLGNRSTLKCEQCDKEFGEKSLLKRHVKFVHQKSKAFVCELCGRGFPQLQNLQKHVSGFHEKLKPFQCKLCKNYFSQTSSLSLHMKKIHKIHWTQKMEKDLEEEPEK